MRRSQVSGVRVFIFSPFCFRILPTLQAQPSHYEPTLESLNQHPLPQWYGDAKLGIFIHWGLYSLGNAKPVAWSQQGDDIRVVLPSALPGHYSYVLKLAGPVS